MSFFTIASSSPESCSFFHLSHLSSSFRQCRGLGTQGFLSEVPVGVVTRDGISDLSSWIESGTSQHIVLSLKKSTTLYATYLLGG